MAKRKKRTWSRSLSLSSSANRHSSASRWASSATRCASASTRSLSSARAPPPLAGTDSRGRSRSSVAPPCRAAAHAAASSSLRYAPSSTGTICSRFRVQGLGFRIRLVPLAPSPPPWFTGHTAPPPHRLEPVAWEMCIHTLHLTPCVLPSLPGGGVNSMGHLHPHIRCTPPLVHTSTGPYLRPLHWSERGRCLNSPASSSV